MSTQIFNGLMLSAVAVLLAGCGLLDPRKELDPGQASGNVGSLAEAEKAVDREIMDDGKIVCAVDGATQLTRNCILEQTLTDKGMLLTVKHPDGGFRKLLVVKDGRGVIAADGADPAIVKTAGARQIEVKLAGDTYLLPAKQGKASNAAPPVGPAPAEKGAKPLAPGEAPAPAPTKS